MFLVDKQLNYSRSIMPNYAKQIKCQSVLDLSSGQRIDLDIFKNQYLLIKSDECIKRSAQEKLATNYFAGK